MTIADSASVEAVVASPVDIRRRNRELYDNVDGPVWHLAVYEPVFGGARYINMGGEPLVAKLIDMLGIGEADPVLDLGCGTGDLAGASLLAHGVPYHRRRNECTAGCARAPDG